MSAIIVIMPLSHRRLAAPGQDHRTDEHRQSDQTEDHVRCGSLVAQTITLSSQWAIEKLFPQTVECGRRLSPSL
jgi:hypothetical protein